MPLEPWIYYSAFATGVYEPEDIYASTMLGAIEMIRSGVTSFIDHLAYDLEGLENSMDAYLESGLRVAIAPLVSDLSYDETLPVWKDEVPKSILKEMENSVKSTSEIINMCKKLIENWHGKDNNQITIMLGPSGPQRCSKDLLLKLHKLAVEYDLGIHTHFVETKLQAQTALKKYNQTMGEYLVDLGILDERWSLAHTVWVSDDEIDIIANKKATVVHNPASNLRLGSGIAPIIDLKEQGVQIAIGTDSCNCGGNLSMFQSMSLAANLSKVTTSKYESWLHSTEVLGMATKGSARTMRLEDEIGEIAIGKRADIVLMDLGTTYLTPQINLINQLIYSETGQSVDTVIIQGKVIMQNKEILTFDEKKILDLAQERYEKIANKIDLGIQQSQEKITFVEELYKKEIDKNIGFHRSAPWRK